MNSFLFRFATPLLERKRRDMWLADACRCNLTLSRKYLIIIFSLYHNRFEILLLVNSSLIFLALDSPFGVGELQWRCPPCMLHVVNSFSFSRLLISTFNLVDSAESLSILAWSRTFSCLNCVTTVLFRPSVPLAIPIADPMSSVCNLFHETERNWKK